MATLSFKDCVAFDLQHTFLNTLEHAEICTIDGRELPVIVDDDALLKRDAARGGVHMDGLYKTRRLIYVSKHDYGGRPRSGKPLNLNGREYRVVQAEESAGLLSIEIEAIRT